MGVPVRRAGNVTFGTHFSRLGAGSGERPRHQGCMLQHIHMWPAFFEVVFNARSTCLPHARGLTCFSCVKPWLVDFARVLAPLWCVIQMGMRWLSKDHCLSEMLPPWWRRMC